MKRMHSLHYLDLGANWLILRILPETPCRPPQAPATGTDKAQTRNRQARLHHRCHRTGPRTAGADCERANIVEGPATDNRAELHRPLYGADTLLRQNIHFAENQKLRRENAPAQAYGKHEAAQLRHHSARTSAEGKRPKTSIPNSRHCSRPSTNAVPKHSAYAHRLLSLKKKAASWACSATYSAPLSESIYVNDPDTHAQIQNYVSLIAPERADIVKLYTKSEPIFDHFSITRQIKSSFRENSVVQERCIHHHRAHRSAPCGRRKLRQPHKSEQ